jgi:hypothetical protein
MARPRNSTTPEAPMTISLKGELAASFREYMLEHGHNVPSQALREILSVYFASMPMDGAVRSARDNALNNTKHWLLTRLSTTFAELQGEMAAETAAIERSGYGR